MTLPVMNGIYIVVAVCAISIYVCDFSIFGDTLLKSEGQLLWWYFQNHCEYPPINYTQTTVRNDIVKIL